MKKRRSHFIFWIGYWALLIYLEYLWAKNYTPGWPAEQMLKKATVGSFLYLLPQLALAYYLVYFALDKIIQKRAGIVTNGLLILIPYVAAICMVVVIAKGVVLPVVYEGVVVPKGAFFEPGKFLSIMIECGFPAGLLTAIKFSEAQLASKEREKNLIKEKLSGELQLLKNQLNPHFLFNTLNNIYALTRKKSEKAPDMVLKLSELLSFMLYDSAEDTVPIGKEVKFLEDYILLQKIRYTDGLSLNFHKQVDDNQQAIAPLLLLPLVENAFKHGASENHFDSFINIRLTLQAQQLLFIIENSFEHTPENNKGSSIGLYNTSRQLELMYREQTLEISKSNNIFKVQLTINLDSYGKI